MVLYTNADRYIRNRNRKGHKQMKDLIILALCIISLFNLYKSMEVNKTYSRAEKILLSLIKAVQLLTE